MNPADYLQLAMGEFSQGKTIFIAQEGEPEPLRKKLYKAAKRRGYNWRFAIDDDRVVIQYRPHSSEKNSYHNYYNSNRNLR